MSYKSADHYQTKMEERSNLTTGQTPPFVGGSLLNQPFGPGSCDPPAVATSETVADHLRRIVQLSVDCRDIGAMIQGCVMGPQPEQDQKEWPHMATILNALQQIDNILTQHKAHLEQTLRSLE
jgi:hypothetical protein